METSNKNVQNQNSHTEIGVHNTNKEVVIVTGSSGMIGSALIHKLAEKYQVVGFDQDGYPNPPVEAECVCVDLTSDTRMDFAFKRIRYAYGNKIASVVHLAAYYDFLGEPSDLYDKVTVKGTERMLKYLQDFEVEQFIFSSSMLVHKSYISGFFLHEESPLISKCLSFISIALSSRKQFVYFQITI